MRLPKRIAPSAFLSPLLHSIYRPLLRVDGSSGNAVSFLCFNLCSINISNGACTSQLTRYLAVKITLSSGRVHVLVEERILSSAWLWGYLSLFHPALDISIILILWCFYVSCLCLLCPSCSSFQPLTTNVTPNMDHFNSHTDNLSFTYCL